LHIKGNNEQYVVRGRLRTYLVDLRHAT